MRGFVFVLSCLSVVACAGGSSSSDGATAGAEPTEGSWSAADAERMSQVFISKCVETSPWAEQFMQTQGRKATVQVSEVENKTGEEVDPNILAHQVESALLNNDSVQVSAGGTAQKDIMNYQASVMALDESAPSVTAPTADFIVSTSLSAMETTEDSDPIRKYTANFRLLQIDGGTIVCGASADAKKLTGE